MKIEFSWSNKQADRNLGASMVKNKVEGLYKQHHLCSRRFRDFRRSGSFGDPVEFLFIEMNRFNFLKVLDLCECIEKVTGVAVEVRIDRILPIAFIEKQDREIRKLRKQLGKQKK